MLPVTLQKFFFLVLHLVMINFHQNTIEACEENVTMACVDNTTCTQTYGEVYSMLASQKNYYNIAQALYPAKRPSSVLVHVRLYGANGTENCTTAKYTWSMSCIYAAFPPNVLEILSWGSIIVAGRKQELNISIPPFCCNVSKDNRKTMIDNVLAALQDLGVSPAIQDPRLNTAECVIEGHEPMLTDTGRSTYIIIATMWSSFIFSIFCGPWLAIITLILFDKSKIKPMVKAAKCVSRLMLVIEVALLIKVIVVLACHNGNVRCHIFPILIILVLEGLLLGVCYKKKCCSICSKCCNSTNRRCCCCSKCCNSTNRRCCCCSKCCNSTNKRCCCKLSGQISIFLWANLTAYHFCWLVIGIMLNALWGVTVLLFVCVIIAACFFSFYNYFYTSGEKCSLHNVVNCATLFLPIISLVAIVVLAGQSVFGRDTTDDVIKTVIFAVTVAFISWILSTMKEDDKSKVSEKKDENKKENKNKKDNEEKDETDTGTVNDSKLEQLPMVKAKNVLK